MDYERSQRITALLAAPGWPDLSGILTGLADEHLDRLRTARRMADIRYSQAVLEVIDGIFREIDAAVQDGRKGERSYG